MKQKQPSIQALRKDSSKLKVIFIAILLSLSLTLALMVMQAPQDIRQRAQRPPPMCAAAADATGICRAAGGCFLGEETDAGALDCSAGQTCCGLAVVPAKCAAISNNTTTFCATEPACANYGGKSEGQQDCQTGTVCCNNPTALTPGAPTSSVPSPTFGTINVPTEEPEPNNPEPEPTEEPVNPENPPIPTPAPPPAQANQNIIIQFLILLITLILGLFGR